MIRYSALHTIPVPPLGYTVERQTYDAARPFAIVAQFRAFNRVVARYEDEAVAKRRCRTLCRAFAEARAGAASISLPVGRRRWHMKERQH